MAVRGGAWRILLGVAGRGVPVSARTAAHRTRAAGKTSRAEEEARRVTINKAMSCDKPPPRGRRAGGRHGTGARWRAGGPLSIFTSVPKRNRCTCQPVAPLAALQSPFPRKSLQVAVFFPFRAKAFRECDRSFSCFLSGIDVYTSSGTVRDFGGRSQRPGGEGTAKRASFHHTPGPGPNPSAGRASRFAPARCRRANGNVSSPSAAPRHRSDPFFLDLRLPVFSPPSTVVIPASEI